MSFTSRTTVKAARDARAAEEAAKKFQSLIEFIAYMRSDPLPTITIEKMLTALRFIRDMSDDHVDRFWELIATHIDGFTHCIGENLDISCAIAAKDAAGSVAAGSAAPSKKIEVILFDVSGSMSGKPPTELNQLVVYTKRLVSKFIQQGHRVVVIYFGRFEGHLPMSGAEFISGYRNPGFNDNATYMAKTLEQLKKLVTDNVGYVVDVTIITDGDISGSDTGPVVEGLGSVDILVFTHEQGYNQVLVSHIRNIEQKTRADIVKVTLINPYDSSFVKIVPEVFEAIANNTSSVPGIISIDGLKFPSVFLKQPSIISSIMSRATAATITQISDFILRLLRGTDDAVNTSFITLLEGRYSGVLRVLQSIRSTSERMTEKYTFEPDTPETKTILRYLDQVYMAAKSLQDKVSRVKDITMKKLESENQGTRADELHRKYIELTQVNQFLEILDRIGDCKFKLVLRCVTARTLEGLRMLILLMRDINKIEACNASALALVFGLISQIRVVPVTGAEKPKGFVPYSLENALDVLRLFPQLVVSDDSPGFTFTPTVAARLALFCKSAIETTEFSPEIVKLINLACDQISPDVMGHLTDLSASAQSNRTASWIEIAKTLPGGEQFSKLQIVNIVFHLGKSNMFGELSVSHIFELPVCPDGLADEFYYQVDTDVLVEVPKKRRSKLSGRASRARRRKAKYGNVAPVRPQTAAEIRADKLRRLMSADELYVFETLYIRAIKSGLSDPADVRKYMSEHPRMTVNRTTTLSVNEVFRHVCRLAIKEVSGDLASVLASFSATKLTELRQLKPSAAFDMVYSVTLPTKDGDDLNPIFEPKVIDMTREFLDRIQTATSRHMTVTAVTPDDYLKNLREVHQSIPQNAGGGADKVDSTNLFTVDICQICQDEKPSGMYKQCGHAAVCVTCAADWKTHLNSIGQPESCVMCRCETSHSSSQ